MTHLPQRVRDFARTLKRETYTLYLAYQHPQTPWYAKAWAFVVVAYAVSPIDLIPDFIPVIGFLDDAILLPMGIWIALRLIPPAVMADCRERSRDVLDKPSSPAGRWAAAIIVVIWVVLAGLVIAALR